MYKYRTFSIVYKIFVLTKRRLNLLYAVLLLKLSMEILSLAIEK